jgi:hypothetical protein
MASIHDLSEYQLYKLKAIDPTLSKNWEDIIDSIMPVLDTESQQRIYQDILVPRGISYDVSQKLVYRRPETLREVVQNLQTNNRGLLSLTQHMLAFIETRQQDYSAMKLAEEVEATLYHLDQLDMDDARIEQKNRQKVRNAYLYDLAEWVENVELTIDAGLRNLDNAAVKAYFKEVFIKQQIQGWDFRSWDSTDLGFQELSYLPAFVMTEGKDRKFTIVEGDDYWFLTGAADDPEKNPYSFRRFLYEDTSGDDHNPYVYLTHIVLKKDQLNNQRYLAHAAHCISRLYTLDRGVSETLLKFSFEIKKLYKTYLHPLLKAPLKNDGSHSELVVQERMIKYEQQLSTLILQKIPKIFRFALHDINDQLYLFYQLDKLFKQMIDNIKDFRLNPLARFSTSTEMLAIKLTSMRLLIAKLRPILCDQTLAEEEKKELLDAPIKDIEHHIDHSDAGLKELKLLRYNIRHHQDIKENGSFWEKMRQGKAPSYTLEEIEEAERSLQNELFLSIVRTAKTYNRTIVYPEFECNEIINDDYRHYALPDGDSGFSRLPRIIKLPENREKFSIHTIKQTLNYDIFSSNQQWKLA